MRTLKSILTDNFANEATRLISDLWNEAENFGEFDDDSITNCNVTKYEGVTFIEERKGCIGTRTLVVSSANALAIFAIKGTKYTDIELISFEVC